MGLFSSASFILEYYRNSDVLMINIKAGGDSPDAYHC